MKVKQILIIIATIIVALSSCQQERDSIDNTSREKVKMNIPLSLSEIQSPKSISTRTNKSSKQSPLTITYLPYLTPKTRGLQTLNNVWVLQFDGDRCIVATNLGSISLGSNLNPTLLTGTNQTIYVIANGPQSSTSFKVGTALSSLENSLTFTDKINTDSSMPYIGKIMGVNIIEGSVNSGAATSPTVTLNRITAKVTVAVDYKVDGYTLGSVEMYNTPQNKYYIYGKDQTLFPSSPSASDILSSALTADNVPTVPTNGNYIWYLGENKRGVNNNISSPLQKDFAHTPSNYCTYIKVKANKSDNSGTSLCYYVYLGENDLSDFNIKRNWDYNFAISIHGSAAYQESAVANDGRIKMEETPIRTANSYFLFPSNKISINVNVKGNGEVSNSNGVSINHNSASVAVLWQSTSGLIANITPIVNGKITVTASKESGNAVIAAYSNANGTGGILWSWHIWVTNYNPNYLINGTIYSYNNLIWMDRNLGATTADIAKPSTVGLLYQWGRKDPYPSSASLDSSVEPPLYTSQGNKTQLSLAYTPRGVTNNLFKSIKEPMKIWYDENSPYDWYTSTSGTQNNSFWGGTSTNAPTPKTIFDPCPAGWRVPTWKNGLSPWNGLGTYSNINYWNYGYDWSLYGGIGYFPASGFRSYANGLLTNVGSAGFSWSASTTDECAYGLGLFKGAIYPEREPNVTYGRNRCMPVRCIRE